MHASCQCGSLTAAIDDRAEAMVIVCHCTACQKRSGSPFGELAYFAIDAVVIGGEAREYTRATDEGNTFTTGFCATCGSTLFGRASAYPGIVGVTVGTLDDAIALAPVRSIYERGRHLWLTLPETTLGFVRGPDGARSR